MTSAFFLDVAGNKKNPDKTWDFVSKLTKGAAVIGEFDPADRKKLWGEKDSRTLGVTHALKNNSKKLAYNFWSFVSPHLAKLDADKPKSVQAVAHQILEAALVDPSEELTPGEIAAHGDQLFWAQDLEFLPEVDQVTANEVYSGIIALLWAGRKVYGDDLKIIPVVGSAVLQNLRPVKGAKMGGFVDIESLIESSQYLKNLKLKSLSKYGDQGDQSVNLMSTLQVNGLIDGFIDQDYNVNYLGHLQPMAEFDPSLNTAYALQINYQNLISSKKPIATPFEMDYSGDLPVNSAAYFLTRQHAIAFDPDTTFKPVPQSVIAVNASNLQLLEGKPVVDLRSLPDGSSVSLQVEIQRDAADDSRGGFYVVLDSDGAVRDPLTGKRVLPGDPAYASVALDEKNLISDMFGFELRQNGEKSVDRVLSDSVMLAPFATVSRSGGDANYFAFPEANSDGFNHFMRMAPNSFGFEDMDGGGDADYNDLVLSLRFLNVV